MKQTAIFMLSAWMACGVVADAHALTFIINNSTVQEGYGPFRLVSADPYDRQTLDMSPSSITFTFSQPLKPDKSMIRVYGPSGGELATGELESDGTSISVGLSEELTPGRYSVKWRTRCQCPEDIQLGETFHFTVQ